jgi:probable F420-dependent oxidoreductase
MSADLLTAIGSTRLGRIGVFSAGLDAVRIGRAQDAAREIEALGYSALWYPDSGARESFVKAALLLSATSSLTVATGIVSMWTRHPRVMYGASAALEDAFPSRFLLGIGVSHQHIVEDVLNERYERPVQSMRDYLVALDEQAAGKPRAPRLIAALGPRMLEVAREQADGAHPYLVTPKHTALAREILGPDKVLAVEQAVSLGSDREMHRSRGRNHLANYLRAPNYVNNWRRLGFDDGDFSDGGSDRLVDAMVVGGTDDAIAARVLEHFDAGADHVCIQALDDNPRQLPKDQWRALAPVFAQLTTLLGRPSGK